LLESWSAYLVAFVSAAIFSFSGFAVTPAEPATQILVSSIGDYDCFGYGTPSHITNIHSPCGTLVAYPIQETDDAANTDMLLACPGPASVTFTHTYDLPAGSRILGAVWSINLGGVEKSKFATTLVLGGQIPVTIPETGPLGTALIVIPIGPPLTSILESGRLTVQLVRGTLSGASCDDVFVDTINLAIAIRP
jgi:hypothetical protein